MYYRRSLNCMPAVRTAKGVVIALHVHGGFLQSNSRRDGVHAERFERRDSGTAGAY